MLAALSWDFTETNFQRLQVILDNYASKQNQMGLLNFSSIVWYKACVSVY